MIEIKNVSYSYENAVTDGALKNVSLCIPQGQTVLLCGESGSGKTTFGRLVNGLIPCYYEGKLTGSVMVNGNDTTQLQLHELAGTVGSVFQNPKSQFYTLLTDTEIVFVCENIGMEKQEILRRFTETVQDFRLEKLLGKNVSQLSGGEKQKIACASVSMLRPPILVLDEPTSNLDISAIRELREIVAQFRRKRLSPSSVPLVAARPRCAISWLGSGTCRAAVCALADGMCGNTATTVSSAISSSCSGPICSQTPSPTISALASPTPPWRRCRPPGGKYKAPQSKKCQEKTLVSLLTIRASPFILCFR